MNQEKIYIAKNPNKATTFNKDTKQNMSITPITNSDA